MVIFHSYVITRGYSEKHKIPWFQSTSQPWKSCLSCRRIFTSLRPKAPGHPPRWRGESWTASIDGKSWENGGKMEGKSENRWFLQGGWWILALCDRKTDGEWRWCSSIWCIEMLPMHKTQCLKTTTKSSNMERYWIQRFNKFRCHWAFNRPMGIIFQSRWIGILAMSYFFPWGTTDIINIVVYL